MSKKRQRIETDGKAQPLSHSPFESLQGIRVGALPLQQDDVNTLPAVAPPVFRVARTRKGGFPISLEKRAAGKVVTVVANVSGDAAALLKALKKRCGAGGVEREGTIEIQGDHRAAVEAFLREHL